MTKRPSHVSDSAHLPCHIWLCPALSYVSQLFIVRLCMNSQKKKILPGNGELSNMKGGVTDLSLDQKLTGSESPVISLPSQKGPFSVKANVSKALWNRRHHYFCFCPQHPPTFSGTYVWENLNINKFKLAKIFLLAALCLCKKKNSFRLLGKHPFWC